MKYHNITKDDMLNGNGLRVVLWVSGCSHKCDGCHNIITWDENTGLEFDKSAKQEIFEELKKDYIQGITFSGGSPLHPANIDDIFKLIKEIRANFPTKDIWVYTGYDFNEIKNLEIIKYIDVLVDGKFIKKLASKNYQWAGSTNQKVIDVKRTLLKGSIVTLN